jgi:hypothetical protein
LVGSASSVKLRITAIPTVSCSGEFLGTMCIIKHSDGAKKKADQTKIRVVQNLYHQNDGFGADDEWVLDLWVGDVTTDGVTETCKCWYIRHPESGDVITSQHKSWNDTKRMIMYIKLLLGSYLNKLGRIGSPGCKLLLWLDNCSLHKTADVKEAFRQMGVSVVFLPHDTTDQL